VLIQAFSWLLILSVFFLGDFKIYYLILFAVIYWVTGMIAGPAWNSWMGDLVDPEHRGAYFSKRNKIIGLVVLVSTVLAGIVLELFKGGAEKQYLGFALIFLTALLARLVSAAYLGKKYEPAMAKVDEKDQFSFWEFIKEARFRNYGLFVIFLTLMNFSIYIAAPFFVAYMLYDLKLNYVQYMIIIAVSFISKYVSLPAWGKLSDRYGNKKIMQLTGFLMPALPLLWMMSTNLYYLISVELYSGIVWGGFELSSFNFIFDTTTPQKRARCVSYFNVLNGILIFFGTTIGSLIIRYNSVFWTKYFLVFFISGILRYAVSIYFLPKLREARPVTEIKYSRLFLKATDMILTESFNNVSFLLYPKKFKLVKKRIIVKFKD
jgi:MFS family permease